MMVATETPSLGSSPPDSASSSRYADRQILLWQKEPCCCYRWNGWRWRDRNEGGERGPRPAGDNRSGTPTSRRCPRTIHSIRYREADRKYNLKPNWAQAQSNNPTVILIPSRVSVSQLERYWGSSGTPASACQICSYFWKELGCASLCIHLLIYLFTIIHQRYIAVLSPAAVALQLPFKSSPFKC